MSLVEEIARAMFQSIPEGHWFREKLTAEPLSIMSQAALSVILGRLREPSEALIRGLVKDAPVDCRIGVYTAQDILKVVANYLDGESK